MSDAFVLIPTTTASRTASDINAIANTITQLTQALEKPAIALVESHTCYSDAEKETILPLLDLLIEYADNEKIQSIYQDYKDPVVANQLANLQSLIWFLEVGSQKGLFHRLSRLVFTQPEFNSINELYLAKNLAQQDLGHSLSFKKATPSSLSPALTANIYMKYDMALWILHTSQIKAFTELGYKMLAFMRSQIEAGLYADLGHTFYKFIPHSMVTTIK